MRSLLPILAMLALAGCENPEPAPAPAPTPEPTPVVKSDWSLIVSSGGQAIVHAPGGKEDLRLYCTADGVIGAQAPTLKPISSEERFSLGAGGDAYVLVADPTTGAVVAEGPMDEALLTALTSDQPISASYGAQTLGPFDAPPEDLRRSFGANCRQRSFEAAAKG